MYMRFPCKTTDLSECQHHVAAYMSTANFGISQPNAEDTATCTGLLDPVSASTNPNVTAKDDNQ
jgi:hypothetical protein